MAVHFASFDLALLCGYFALLLWLGVRVGRRTKGDKGPSQDEFLLANRSLPLPIFVGSLVSTWYGGILGVGEITYKHGLVSWLTQGIFWYVSYLVFALLLAPRLHRSRLTTLPEQIGLMHGNTARLLATALNYINVVPVAYVLSLGLVVHLITGWPIWFGVFVGTGIAIFYSHVGGFRAVVHTDMLQFVLMCCGVALLMISSVSTLGKSDFLTLHLPNSHLTLVGKMSLQEIVVWAIIAFSTLVDPNFYHRCYAANSAKTARNGMLLAIAFWLLFDVCTVFTGLYARATLTNIDPRMAYPLLAEQLLAPGIKGLFFAGILATIMSTLDSYCFVGAMTLSHDVYNKTLHPNATPQQVVRTTRFGIVITAAAAIIIAFLSGGSFQAIWKTLGSLSSATILVPMLLGLSGWRPKGAGATAIIGGAFGSLGWSALRRFGVSWAQPIEAILPGLSLSLAGYVTCGLRRGGRHT